MALVRSSTRRREKHVTSISGDPTALVPAVVGAQAPRARMDSNAPTRDLNGQWRFQLSPRAETGVGLDDPGHDWGTIPVPAHWQLHGHGQPAYTNVRYPFPLDAPRVPNDNPTGEYRRDFDMTADDLASGRWWLRFDGVDSALVVAVNGREVGQSTGSRLPVEFDITDLLAPGSNLLAARVHQWSAGSYLEDQDQWWLSGIFRDVTLVHRPAGGVADVHVLTDYDRPTGLGTLTAQVFLTDDAIGEQPAVRLELVELGVVVAPGESVTLPVSPWSAEDPVLYTLTVATASEIVTVRVGFRRVSITDGVLELNGRPMQFRGANRHEFHPATGRAVTRETMLHDVMLMKAHHFNAVRTSHYPPHPHFLDLCDEYGLYVIDECDLETHGFEVVGWQGNPSDDPRWHDAIVDRGRRLVARDRNHPSIVMWSLGNEAGLGRNLAALAAAIREADASRPIHYEPDQAARYVDVYSRMYAAHDECDRIGAGTDEPLADLEASARRAAMPFVLCEYAHAMGNGPGGVAEYDEIFDRYPRCAGGFIWEWIDHGLPAQLPDGREFPAYGGDFGEVLHDGSFVIDGLLFPDRTPSPGMLEVAAVNAPVRMTCDLDAAVVRVRSRLQQVDLADAELRWRLESGGLELASGTLALPAIAPGAEVVISLTSDIVDAFALPPIADDALAPNERWLTIEAVTTQSQPWAGAGHLLGRAQVLISNEPMIWSARAGAASARPEEWTVGPARFNTDGDLIALGDMVFDVAKLDVWRAPTDNDLATGWGETEGSADGWRRLGLHRMTHRVDDVTLDPEQGSLTVRSRVAAAASADALMVTTTWTAVDSESREGVRVDLDIVPEGEWSVTLPRLGMTFATPCESPESVAVQWFGRGPGEAYWDSRAAVWLSRFTSSVADMQTPYVRPQENGVRKEVRWARLDDDGRCLDIVGDAMFDLTVRPWSIEHLEAARHRTDLVNDERLWWHVDIGQDGLGTATCGPTILAAHRFRAVPVHLSFILTLTGATDALPSSEESA